MAVGKFSEPLNNYIRENKINNIYISSFIPQKFILSKTDVFITSGGHNSILEAIYYKVPMLITPISSEQRLNEISNDLRNKNNNFKSMRDYIYDN